MDITCDLVTSVTALLDPIGYFRGTGPSECGLECINDLSSMMDYLFGTEIWTMSEFIESIYVLGEE